MQKKFNAIINGKGGVGKSFFAVNFIQYLKDNSIAHIAVDTDNENSTLKRFHPEAVFLDIEYLVLKHYPSNNSIQPPELSLVWIS